MEIPRICAVLNTEEELKVNERADLKFENEVLRLGEEVARLLRSLQNETMARRRAETLYEEAQRFESLARFTCSAAFELNQAINVARSYADGVSNEVMTVDAEQQVEAMQQAIDRAAVIVRQLLILHADSAKRREEDFRFSQAS